MNPDDLKASFPDAVHFPDELRELCFWLGSNGYPISGSFELQISGGKTVGYWFGHNRVTDRFGLFGAGPDGSLYGIWRQDDGRQPIVHMGSEGQNNSVLAGSFREFLRLLAIGYDEIGFDDLANPPAEASGRNPKFQRWVQERYLVTIPRCGTEITLPAQQTHETFQEWIEKNL